MLIREARSVNPAAAGTVAFDPNVRSLLDHIAAELAEEYIRLMEAAAARELGASGADGAATGGDER
jgi:hypothetical protein